MSFSSTVTLGVVGNTISAVKILSCGADSACSGGDQIIGYDNVTVSSFPLVVHNIPNNTQYIKLVALGSECESVSQCLAISSIPGPSYSVVPVSTTVNEGGTVTFNVTTEYVNNGTTLYWFVDTNSSSSASDFGTTGSGPTSGSVSILDNTGSFTVNIHADNFTDGGPETFFVKLTTTNNQSATAVATSTNVTILDSSTTPVIVPTYDVEPQSSNVNEGNSLQFDVTTTNVTNGTTLYWFVNYGGASQSGDFVSVSGQFLVSNNVGSFSVTLNTDSVYEESESFSVDLRTTNNQSASVVANSGAVTINDKTVTYDIIPASYLVNEGSTLIFTVNTRNVPNSTVLYWKVNFNGGSTASGDFDAISGTTTITNNTNTFNLEIIGDNVTEGSQTFYVELRTDSITGTIVDYTNPITITDSSIDPVPTYDVEPQSGNVNEGSNLQFNVTTTNVANGTTLYWFINYNNTSQEADFADISGDFNITDNGGSFSVALSSDLVYETSEAFSVDLRTTNNQAAAVVANSGTVTINDKTVTYNISPSVTSANEGSTVTFTVSTTNVPNSTVLYWKVNYNNSSEIEDFTPPISGTTTITNNASTFNLEIAADNFTDGTETFFVELITGSIGGTVVAYTSAITIGDISLTPLPSSYLFYAAAGISGAQGDWVTFTDTTTTFKFNSLTEDFETYIGRRISTSDRIQIYTHDVCINKNTVTYSLNYVHKAGQTGSAQSAIGAIFAHPVSMGTIVEFKDISTNQTYQPVPIGGRTTSGTDFKIGSVYYRLYRFLNNQVTGTNNFTLRVTTCS
jgi:hypothetical protein